jgi:hypothetical protein
MALKLPARWEPTPDWLDPVAVGRAWTGFPVGRELTLAERVRLAEMALQVPEGDGRRGNFAKMVGVSGGRATELLKFAKQRLGMLDTEAVA